MELKDVIDRMRDDEQIRLVQSGEILFSGTVGDYPYKLLDKFKRPVTMLLSGIDSEEEPYIKVLIGSGE